MGRNDIASVASGNITERVREQSPSHLSVCCLLNGIEPVPPDQPFTYLVIGEGQGFAINVLAASNPQGSFYAVELLSEHVAASKDFAQQAQLSNIHFLEGGIAAMVAGKVALPSFDYIVLPGVYNWLSAMNRAAVVELTARLLKPAGILYVSYNALPGGACTLPFQRLLLQASNAHPCQRNGPDIDPPMSEGTQGPSKVDAGLAQRLNSSLLYEDVGRTDGVMHPGWQPLYHADVVRDLAPVGVQFIGSSDPTRAWPDEFLTQRQIELLREVQPPSVRETVSDFLLNTNFRADVFVRGARCLSFERREQWLAKVGFTLSVPTKGVAHLRDQADTGLLNIIAKRYNSILSLASQSGRSTDSLLRLAARLSVRDEACLFFVSGLKADRAPARRLNEVIARLSRLNDRCRLMASSLLGQGVTPDRVEYWD